MSRRRVIVLVSVCLTITVLLVAWGIIAHLSSKFDEERFQDDVERIEAWYFDYQEGLDSIAQAFWEHEEIEGISVRPFEEKTVELWLTDGKTETFAEDYPQLYRDANALLETDLQWTSFKIKEGQDGVVECSVLVDRYETGKWTAFYLCFLEESTPSVDADEYYRQLSDKCFLAVKSYPMV